MTHYAESLKVEDVNHAINFLIQNYGETGRRPVKPFMARGVSETHGDTLVDEETSKIDDFSGHECAELRAVFYVAKATLLDDTMEEKTYQRPLNN